MNQLHKHNRLLSLVTIIVVLAIFGYLFVNLNFDIFSYAINIRFPKLVVMIIASIAIGSASIVFQTLINNVIVTPCLLGMNSLYILINTMVVFLIGSSSILITNKTISFIINLFIMVVMSYIIYGFLFKKTKGNILFILLSGTILATLFSSITSTMQRIMDPNAFDALQNTLIASFNKSNSSIIMIAIILLVSVFIYFFKELKMLDVITLGRHQAINLGVDYDRVVNRLLVFVTILISIATALVGPISFLGLIIANLARQIFKTHRHKYLIIATSFIGIIVLLVGQTFIEHIFNYSANISSLINIVGGLYFLYLLMKRRS